MAGQNTKKPPVSMTKIYLLSLAAIALVAVALVGERSRKLTGIVAAMSF